MLLSRVSRKRNVLNLCLFVVNKTVHNKWQPVHCFIRTNLLKISAAKMSSKSRKRVGEGTEEVSPKTRPKTARTRRTIKIEVEKEESDYFPQANKKATTSSKVTKNIKVEQEDLEANNRDGEPTSVVKSDTLPTQDLSMESDKTGKQGRTTSKNVEVKLEPPFEWEKIYQNIQTMRSSKTAAVDTMGCERTADLKEEPKVQRFQTLVSLMLSSQTKDQVTFAAMERLKERKLTVQAMLDIDETTLAEILTPVGFYKRKASYIKRTAEILREKYSDDIPNTIKDLCSLPGVGPKMAYICMNAAWNENSGIGVDTHVHRISNRLKWTGKKGTQTPEKTREALESWIPKELWQEINILLVGFGQEICLPVGPKCNSCLNKSICPSANTTKSAKNVKKQTN